LKSSHDSPQALTGLLNKIQGQLGEDAFVKAVGHSAHLAPSGSQEGWDVVVHQHGVDQYVQVKVYIDANQAVEALKELQTKIDAGVLHGGGHVIHSVDFCGQLRYL